MKIDTIWSLVIILIYLYLHKSKSTAAAVKFLPTNFAPDNGLQIKRYQRDSDINHYTIEPMVYYDDGRPTVSEYMDANYFEDYNYALQSLITTEPMIINCKALVPQNKEPGDKLQPGIKDLLREIEFPRLDRLGIHLGKTLIGLHSPVLHRFLRKYYYTVLKIVFTLPDDNDLIEFYQKFNEQMGVLMNKLLQLRNSDYGEVIKGSNLYLQWMEDFFVAHKSNIPSPDDLPPENALHPEVCQKYVSLGSYQFSKDHHLRVNVGPLNAVSRKQWLEHGCPTFFEESVSNIIPYFDDDGVDVSPPEIQSKNLVRLRGNNVYSGEQLFAGGTLLAFYRCVLMKISSVPRHSEKLCYYHEFDRGFLKFLNAFQSTKKIIVRNVGKITYDSEESRDFDWNVDEWKRNHRGTSAVVKRIINELTARTCRNHHKHFTSLKLKQNKRSSRYKPVIVHGVLRDQMFNSFRDQLPSGNKQQENLQ